MSSKYIRRYTDLPALIYLLTKRTLTLLDPQSWDDSNDSHYLTLYCENRHLETALVLCFTQADETYHHWRVFAPGSSGVCIRFDRTKLMQAVKKHRGIRSGPVKYLKLTELRGYEPKARDLPFLKRYAYEHEREFRILYEDSAKCVSKLDLPIPLSAVDRVTLSPWINPSLTAQVKSTIRSIRGCSGLNVVRSTLIGNEEWKRLGEESS